MAQIALVFEQLMALHERLGLPSLSQMPGHVWTHQLDAHWFLALNGNPEKVTLGPDDGSTHPMLVPVSPFCCGVWFNGFYAGEFDPQGGVLCAGSLANEDALISALEKAGHGP